MRRSIFAITLFITSIFYFSLLAKTPNIGLENAFYQEQNYCTKYLSTIEIDTLPTVKAVYDTLGRFNWYNEMYNGIYWYGQGKGYFGQDVEFVRIDFYDSIGLKINEFDIQANNPFGKKDVSGNNTIFFKEEFVKMKTDTVIYEKSQIKYIFKEQLSSTGELPVVGYHRVKVNGDQNGEYLNWTFSAVCLNEVGEIVHTLSDLDIDPVSFSMSNDKKFLAITFGGLRGENLEKMRNSGFRLYNLETRKIVFEILCDDYHTTGGTAWNDEYECFVVSVEENELGAPFEDDYTYYIIYPEAGVVYSKIFYPEQKAKIIGADRSGFIILNNGNKDKLLYEQDFDVIRF
jgi:hypothetical protein